MSFMPGTLTMPFTIGPSVSTISYLVTMYTESDSELVIIGHFRSKEGALTLVTESITNMLNTLTKSESPYQVVFSDKVVEVSRNGKVEVVYRITPLHDDTRVYIQTF